MGSVSFWSLDDEHSLVEEEYRTMFCDNEGFCSTDWTELFEQWDKLDQLPFSVRHSGSSSDTIFDGVKNSGNSPASCNVGNSALPTSSAPTPPRVLNASLLRQLLPKRAQKPKLNNHLGKCPCPPPLQSTPHEKAPSPAPPALKPSSLIQEPFKLSSLGKTIKSDDHYEEATLSLPRGNATADDCGGGTNRMVTRKRMFACLDNGGARGANRKMAFKQRSESLGAGGGRGTHELMTSFRSSSKEKVECETIRRRLKLTSLFCTLRAILPFDVPQNDRYILVDTTCHYIAFLQQQLERLKAKTHILKYAIMEQEMRGSKLRPNAESEFESQTVPKAASTSQLELSSDLAPSVTVFVSEGRMLYITVSCYEESLGLFATILDTLEQRGLDIHSANRSQHEHGEVTVVYAFHVATVQKSSLCFRDIEELKTDLFAKAASKL